MVTGRRDTVMIRSNVPSGWSNSAQWRHLLRYIRSAAHVNSVVVVRIEYVL
jgi:hypothetical protein